MKFFGMEIGFKDRHHHHHHHHRRSFGSRANRAPQSEAESSISPSNLFSTQMASKVDKMLQNTTQQREIEQWSEIAGPVPLPAAHSHVMDGGRRERFEDHRENSQKVFSHYQSSGSLSPVGSHPSAHESRSSALLPSSVVGGSSSGPPSATSATAAATSSSSHAYYDGGRTMSSYGDRGGKSRDDDEDTDMRDDDQQGSVDVLGGIGGGGRAFPAATMPSRYTVGLGSGSTLSRVSDRDFDDLSGSSSIPLESSASQRISNDENNNSSFGGGTLLTYRHASSSPPSGFHHRRRTSTSGLHHVQFVHHRRLSASSSSPGGTGQLHSHDEDQDMDYEMGANVATPSAESAATLSETELVEQEAKRRRYERDSARRRQEKSGNNVADPPVRRKKRKKAKDLRKHVLLKNAQTLLD